MRTEGVLFLPPRVAMAGPGDSGESTGNFDAATTRRFFAEGVLLPPRPPDAGEDGVDLAAAPRFTGDFLGEAGGFFLDEAAAAAAGARLRGGLLDVSFLGDIFLPSSGLFFFLVVGVVRRGGGEAFPSPIAPSRASLMFLNCRLISAVWGLDFSGGREGGGGGYERASTKEKV